MTSSTLTFLPFDDIWCTVYTYLHFIPFSFQFSHYSILCGVQFNKITFAFIEIEFYPRKMATEAQKNDKDYQKVVELQALRNEQRNIVNNISTLELDLKEHK